MFVEVSVIVAMPFTRFTVVGDDSVPEPVTLNVTCPVALLLFWSFTVAVIVDWLVPFATMEVGFAVQVTV